MSLGSNRTRLAAIAVLCLIPLSVALVDQPAAAQPGDYQPSDYQPMLLPHPHFTKTLNCQVSKGLEITMKHLTVTYNKKGAEKMAVGAAWHLGGAVFETTGDLLIGGQKVKAGKYALSARKAKKGWQLTLHEGRGFSRPGEDAIVLKTDWRGGTLLFEHLNCDIQPGGDKKSTKLFLDVRFDKMLARVLIEIPE